MKFTTPFPKLLRWLFSIALLLLVFATIMRVGFFFFFNKQGQPIGSFSGALFLGFRFDLRTVSLLLLSIGVIGSIPGLHPFKNNTSFKVWSWIIGVVLFVMTFFYVVDFAHYAYLSQRLNASVLNYLEDAGISTEMVWQSYPVIRLFLRVFIVTFLLIWIIRKFHKRISASSPPVSRKRKLVSYSVFFLLLAFFLFGRFDQYPLRWSDAYALGSDFEANLALNPFESFFNTLKFRAKKPDPNKVKEDFAFLADYYDWNKSDSASLNYSRYYPVDTTRAAKQPNIVLVICESFSAYKASMWKNPLATTPFFDSMSRNGLFFERCFTPTYGTARGVWATITGLPDVELQLTASRNPAAVDQQTVLESIKGYEKYYFIGGSPSWANIRGLLMNNLPGLHLYEQENLKSPRLDVWGISDKNLFLEANQILSAEKKPFFAIIQTADNHRPYSLPPEDADFIVQKPSEDSLNKYGFRDQVNYDSKLKEYNAFRYTDYSFQKFIHAAQKEAYFNNTLFVFIGDHGIAGEVGEMFPRAWTEKGLTAEHVPLLFYAPSWLPAKRESLVCSQVDVMPTIASICNLPYRNTTLGRNLTDTAHLRPFAFIYNPDTKLIGVVKGDYFYREQLTSGKEEMVSIINNEKPSAEVMNGPVKQEMKQLTKAVYETASYLLVNNKKESSQNKK